MYAHAHICKYLYVCIYIYTHIYIYIHHQYPGLLDQMVAGGQPAGKSFVQNVKKESEEEASLPPERSEEHTSELQSR